MTDEEVILLIREADANRDGKLDYQEVRKTSVVTVHKFSHVLFQFCHMMMSTSNQCKANSLKKLAEREKPRPDEGELSKEPKDSVKKKQKKQPSQNGFDRGYLEQSDDEPTSVSTKEEKPKVSKVSSSKTSPITSPQRLSSLGSSPKTARAKGRHQAQENKPLLKLENAVSPPAVSVEEFVVSEGSGTDEDDLVVVTDSGRGKLESRSETVVTAGGLSASRAVLDRLKSKSSSLLKKGQKEPALDLSTPGSHSASASKGKKGKVKEPRNLKVLLDAHNHRVLDGLMDGEAGRWTDRLTDIQI